VAVIANRRGFLKTAAGPRIGGIVYAESARKVEAHLSMCARCMEIIEEAARGLAILSSASEPPSDLLQHARARRWAVKGDATAIGLPFEEAEDIAEVSGRDRDAAEAANEKTDGTDSEIEQ